MFCSNCGKEPAGESQLCSECRAALAGQAVDAARVSQKPKKKMSGCIFALIVVAAIGVVAIIGIISVSAINAIDRGKQKRTMKYLRIVATAIEGFSVDHRVYPTAMDIETLSDLLEPYCTRAVPAVDGWARSFVVESNSTGYRIYSLGKDGISDGCPGGGTQTFFADICFADGEFTQWPEGVQR